MSKDAASPIDGVESMGEIFRDYELGALSGSLHLGALSQEHGILSCNLPVGQRVRILPNHSCLTVACFNECAVVRGDRVVDRWKIWSGR